MNVLVRFKSTGDGKLRPETHVTQRVTAEYFPVIEGLRRVRTESGDVWNCKEQAGRNYQLVAVQKVG